MGFQGIMYARLIGGLIILLFTLFIIILPRCTFKISLQPLKQAIIFGLPYVISTIGYTLFMLSDRFMLNWLSTSEQMGKYGFGFKIANFINLIFVQTIGMSYFPSVMSNENKSDNIRYYRKMLTYYCLFIAFLILGFLFYYQDILKIVGKNKEYWDGLKVVPLLSLSFMIMGMNYFVGVGLFLKKATKQYVLPSFIAFGINFLLNLWLIPVMGMMGAAYSVVSAQIVYVAIVSYSSGKHLKIDFEWNKILLIYSLAIVLFVCQQWLKINNFLISSAVKLIILSSFPVILYKLNFFEKIEIQRVKEGFFKSIQRIGLIRHK
jgi:O-antigen/teichoic acid export membrane protein